MTGKTLAISTLKKWANIADESYPRRTYVKVCFCKHKVSESHIGYNCPKCGKKDSLKIAELKK